MRIRVAVTALAALFVATCEPAWSSVNLSAGVERASPDGRLVTLNGCVVSTDGNMVGLVYEWGDGEVDFGFFPRTHKYHSPGGYTARLSGYDDRGDTATDSVPCTVPVPPSTTVSSVSLSQYGLGLKCGEEALIPVWARDASGAPIPLARSIHEGE